MENSTGSPRLYCSCNPDKDIAPLDEVSSERAISGNFSNHVVYPRLILIDVLSIVEGYDEDLSQLDIKYGKSLGIGRNYLDGMRVLLKAGESAIINDQANEQFHGASGFMPRIVAFNHSMDATERSWNWEDLWSWMPICLDINCPLEYVSEYWVVEFQDVMKKVLDVLTAWHIDTSVVARDGKIEKYRRIA